MCIIIVLWKNKVCLIIWLAGYCSLELYWFRFGRRGHHCKQNCMMLMRYALGMVSGDSIWSSNSKKCSLTELTPEFYDNASHNNALYLMANRYLINRPDKMNAFPLRLCILRLPSLPTTSISELDSNDAVWELSPAPTGKPVVSTSIHFFVIESNK